MTLPPNAPESDDRALEVLKSIDLEGLIQAIPDIAYIKDAGRRNLIVNGAFEAAFGLTQADVMGKRDEEILPPGLAAACKASDEAALSGGGAIRFEEEASGQDGHPLFYDTTKAPILSADGRIIGLIGISRDITKRKMIERALQASEERYRRMVETSLDGIYQSTPEGRFLQANTAAQRMMGCASFEELQDLGILATYADRRQRDRFLQVMRRDGEVRAMELKLRSKDGTQLDVLASAKAVTDKSGRTIFEGILTDITAQKENERALGAALAEKDVLLKEIHHRVKNNLQVISSLLSLQSRYLRHPEDAVLFHESQRRIRSIALVHERLYQSKNLSRIEFAAYAKRLVENLIASHREGGGPVSLETDLEEVFLDIQTAIPCGLIVNELIMNALKHAFPDGRPGTIRLALRPERDGRVELRVGDDGIGLPAGWDIDSAGSMGMQIVAMLTGQIEGRLEIDRSAGTQFLLSFKELQYKPRL
jgi:PAS domain S-box-containing protein